MAKIICENPYKNVFVYQCVPHLDNTPRICIEQMDCKNSQIELTVQETVNLITALNHTLSKIGS